MDNKNERIELPGGYFLKLDARGIYYTLRCPGGTHAATTSDGGFFKNEAYNFAAAMKTAEVSLTDGFERGQGTLLLAGSIIKSSNDPDLVQLAKAYLKLADEDLHITPALIEEAELRGARKMQMAVARMVETHAVTQNGQYTKVVDAPPQGSNFDKMGTAVRSLKPEEVIK